jgi:hypothetical protein
MSPTAVRELDDDEGRQLMRIIRRGSGPVVTWQRAQMVLLSAQGMDMAAIAKVATEAAPPFRGVLWPEPGGAGTAPIRSWSDIVSVSVTTRPTRPPANSSTSIPVPIILAGRALFTSRGLRAALIAGRLRW